MEGSSGGDDQCDPNSVSEPDSFLQESLGFQFNRWLKEKVADGSLEEDDESKFLRAVQKIGQVPKLRDLFLIESKAEMREMFGEGGIRGVAAFSKGGKSFKATYSEVRRRIMLGISTEYMYSYDATSRSPFLDWNTKMWGPKGGMKPSMRPSPSSQKTQIEELMYANLQSSKFCLVESAWLEERWPNDLYWPKGYAEVYHLVRYINMTKSDWKEDVNAKQWTVFVKSLIKLELPIEEFISVELESLRSLLRPHGLRDAAEDFYDRLQRVIEGKTHEPNKALRHLSLNSSAGPEPAHIPNAPLRYIPGDFYCVPACVYDKLQQWYGGALPTSYLIRSYGTRQSYYSPDRENPYLVDISSPRIEREWTSESEKTILSLCTNYYDRSRVHLFPIHVGLYIEDCVRGVLRAWFLLLLTGSFLNQCNPRTGKPCGGLPEISYYSRDRTARELLNQAAKREFVVKAILPEISLTGANRKRGTGIKCQNIELDNLATRFGHIPCQADNNRDVEAKMKPTLPEFPFRLWYYEERTLFKPFEIEERVEARYQGVWYPGDLIGLPKADKWGRYGVVCDADKKLKDKPKTMCKTIRRVVPAPGDGKIVRRWKYLLSNLIDAPFQTLDREFNCDGVLATGCVSCILRIGGTRSKLVTWFGAWTPKIQRYLPRSSRDKKEAFKFITLDMLIHGMNTLILVMNNVKSSANVTIRVRLGCIKLSYILVKQIPSDLPLLDLDHKPSGRVALARI
eukprot:jgi/Bigna1/68570/fgenesh1_pg.6_\